MNTVCLCYPGVSREGTSLEGGSICTTLNTKLLVLLALRVWAKRQGTLEQEVNSVQTIPAYPTGLRRHRKKDFRFQVGVCFLQRWSKGSPMGPRQLWRLWERQSDLNQGRILTVGRRVQGARDPLFSHLRGVYLASDTATGGLEVGRWCNKPKNQCSILIPSGWSL